MNRNILFHSTGATASSLVVTQRVTREIRGAKRRGQNALVNRDSISVEGKHVRQAEADSLVVRCGGVSLAEQHFGADRPVPSQEGL